MSIKIVRYGIVGVGGFGAVRRRTLRETGRFEILGGVDINSKAFQAAELEEGKLLRQYPTVQALVEDPDIDAVFVASPPYLHVEQAMIAAKAGKAVFTEKPLGHDYDCCAELVEYCEQNKIPHGHGFSTRHLDVWQYVKGQLEQKVLGQIVGISASTMHQGGLILPAENWRFVEGRNPGGPLFQCGIHKIDLLRFLFGEGAWLAGLLNRNVTKSATDDSYVLLGTFGGVPTTLHNHYVSPYRNAVEIYGAEGNFFISEDPTKLERRTSDTTPVLDLTNEIPQARAEFHSLREFADAVFERRQPIVNGREGLNSLKLVLEASRVATLNKQII